MHLALYGGRQGPAVHLFKWVFVAAWYLLHTRYSGGARKSCWKGSGPWQVDPYLAMLWAAAKAVVPSWLC